MGVIGPATSECIFSRGRLALFGEVLDIIRVDLFLRHVSFSFNEHNPKVVVYLYMAYSLVTVCDL